MEKKTDYQYLVIPLCSLQRIYTHPRSAIYDLFCLGVYFLTKQIEEEKEDSLFRVLFCYFKEPKELTKELKRSLDHFIEEAYPEPDERFSSLSEAPFVLKEMVSNLRKYMETGEDPALPGMAQEFAHVYSIKKRLEVTFLTSAMIHTIRKLKSYDRKGEPYILVKKDMLFDFLYHSKRAYERDMLACYLGIRSLLGKKDYVGTNKKMILSRMLGVKSPDFLSEALRFDALKKVHGIYSKRHHMDRLLDKLVVKRFVVRFSSSKLRNIYFSTRLNLNELEESVYQGEFTSEKRVLARIKKAEREAANRLHTRIFGEK